MSERPDWDDYFLRVSNVVADRATCDRGRAGCVIAKDKQILATGYVGAPAGLPHCDEVGHQMKEVTHEDGESSQHCVRTCHAEQNAIIQADDCEGATLYVTHQPCFMCAKMLINAGIDRIVFDKEYTDRDAERFMREAGVTLDVLD